jgi:hypothetical protein
MSTPIGIRWGEGDLFSAATTPSAICEGVGEANKLFQRSFVKATLRRIPLHDDCLFG